jgi:hypothetical protein
LVNGFKSLDCGTGRQAGLSNQQVQTLPNLSGDCLLMGQTGGAFTASRQVIGGVFMYMGRQFVIQKSAQRIIF